MVGHVVVDGVYVDGASVGQDELEEESPKHEVQAADGLVGVEGVLLVELWQQVRAALYGSGHELREEGDKEGVGGEVALGAGVAPVDVDEVAQGLEDVERDAHGQQHLQFGHVHTDAQPRHQRDNVLGGEVEVLEEEEDEQVDDDGRDEDGFAAGEGGRGLQIPSSLRGLQIPSNLQIPGK